MARWDAAWHRRLDEVIAGLPGKPLAEQTAIRRQLAQDPIAFAILYLRHHLRMPDGRVTFSEVHYAWARRAMEWRAPVTEPMSSRHAEIAPRATGKSTWWFLIVPLWAAAHGHIRFAAAFAHSATQAAQHLRTFKGEVERNPLLAHDFPELCDLVMSQAMMLQTRSGFTFAARGMDCASLGLKVGEQRPDVLILDDVEPDESSYSPYLAEKRLITMTDAVLALNIYARVVLVGTVTMPGSIIHQVVKAADGEEHPVWVDEENIQAHHYLAIAVNDDGTERSIWPEKWPLAWLQSRRHTAEYAKNYDNNPSSIDGGYWTAADFRYGALEAATRCALFVDPAVTTKKTSDRTGLAVVSWSPTEQACQVEAAAGVRLTGRALREHILGVLEVHPRIRAVIVEANQGGEVWHDILHDLPGVKVITRSEGESKEVRFARALDHYQRGRVVHVDRLQQAETEMIGFPRAALRDVADAVVAGVLYFMPPESAQPAPRRPRVSSYA